MKLYYMGLTNYEYILKEEYVVNLYIIMFLGR
jgi:hypothetical protein